MRRRALISRSAAAALCGLPAMASDVPVKPLPPAALRSSNPDEYWLKVREEQFLLPEWRVFLNNGSLGIAPRPVLAAVEDYLERSASLQVDDYPRWGYETLDAERATMAEFVGCKKDELAFMHNATDALSTIAAGIDLNAGDEVLMTDQEHPSGRSGWQVRAKRHSIQVREVKIPTPPRNSGQLADLMISSIGPRTRVLFFSGILSPTGIIMPVREICDAARAKGIITVVDGAHMNGQIPFRISDLNCDYFAGSPHKWMFTPAGCGLLYVREENLDKLWPTVVTGGWDDPNLKANRYMRMGTNNRAIFVGMMAGLQFLNELGPDNVYARIHQLAKMNYQLASARPYLELASGADDRLYGSLVTIRFKTDQLAPLWAKMNQRKIWTLQGPQVRLSTHVHTRPQDIETFYEVCDSVLGAPARKSA